MRDLRGFRRYEGGIDSLFPGGFARPKRPPIHLIFAGRNVRRTVLIDNRNFEAAISPDLSLYKRTLIGFRNRHRPAFRSIIIVFRLNCNRSSSFFLFNGEIGF